MAPVDNSPTGSMSGFQLICSYTSNDLIPVHKYKSLNTGLNVFIADVDGPLVCGYFVLATEAFDDDGLPHTLEHLIFIGSEKYPYKGVLDLLANRCFASGTNAWTETDHTAYTMENAGSEGFLSLMPVYIEHILFPTLTDSAYTTEVHHITGEGEDAGIVYSEMQGCMNSGEQLTYLEMLRAAYPGKCGYKSFTGGALKNLRESTSNEKVRQYHKDFYRPENLTIVITGQVKHTEVFKALQEVEEKILSKGPRDLFKKPWQDEVPPLTESADLNVYYPCDDEDNGMVFAAWRGPSTISEYYDLKGCALLLKYLTDTSVSPLQQEFVEIDDPFANDVSYDVEEYSKTLFILKFDNVPKEKIPQVKDRLMKVLKDIGSNKNGMDMKRLATVIQKYILQIQSSLENCPHRAIAFTLIGDILFGNSNEDLNKRLNVIDILRKLLNEPESYWLNLLNKYFVNAPVVFSKGIPSIEKKLEMSKEERERIEKQKKTLGKTGLEKKRMDLEKAIAENEIPVPDDILTSVPIPDMDSINFHYIKSFSTDSLEQHPRFDVNKLPLYTYLDHANTNFVYLFVAMDTSKVPGNLRYYIPLLLESMLVCPINRDGKLIPYEEVVTELESDTIEVSSGIGIKDGARFTCDIFNQAANLMLQVEMSKYAKGVQWIKELLYQSEFTPERLKVTGVKILNEVPSVKRGYRMTDHLLNGLIYNKESNYYTSSVLRQQKFLLKLLERLETDDGKKEVTKEINEVRRILTTPNSMALHMAFNVDKLVAQNPNVYEPWKEFFFDIQTPDKSKLKIDLDSKFINSLEKIPLNGCVTGIGCIESAFMKQCTPCMKDVMHPDKAALLVYLQYLTQLEGPMWKKIRGQGHAYSYNMHITFDGNLNLTLFKATNLVNAYKEARAIIESYLSEDKWESALFESARSSLIFEIISKEKTIEDMIKQSLLSNYLKVPHDYNRQLVKKISTITLEDIHRVGPQYVKKLLNPKVCTTSIVCHPDKVEEVAKAFNEIGYDLKVYNSLEETHLNEL